MTEKLSDWGGRWLRIRHRVSASLKYRPTAAHNVRVRPPQESSPGLQIGTREVPGPPQYIVTLEALLWQILTQCSPVLPWSNTTSSAGFGGHFEQQKRKTEEGEGEGEAVQQSLPLQKGKGGMIWTRMYPWGVEGSVWGDGGWGGEGGGFLVFDEVKWDWA